MTLLKIFFYIFKSAFDFKRRIISIEVSRDGKTHDILLWGVATEVGWKALVEEKGQEEKHE